MKRVLAAAIAIGLFAGGSLTANAGDGHGNVDNPARTVPNTGSISGGPTHRDDPRVRESREIRADGRPAHGPNDGHKHGHD
jgi:hypothetical protein